MEIIPHPNQHPRINIIEILGPLTGKGVIQLKEYLCSCLDKETRYILIDFEFVRMIDSVAITVLESFVKRRVMVRLFNAKQEICDIMRVLKKDGIIKIYDETNYDKAVSLFEKEILESSAEDCIKKRTHSRVETSIKMDFKYHPGHNGVISGKAHILNLSEGGILADQITTLDPKTGKIIEADFSGNELYDMQFTLSDSPNLINSKGKCVREVKKDKHLCAGIRFTDVNDDNKDMIRNYVLKYVV